MIINLLFRCLTLFFFLFQMVVASSDNFAREQNENKSTNKGEILKYPYIASPEKEQRILLNIGNLQLGMKAQDIVRFLGEPDEINKTYEPKYVNPKIIGRSFVYLLARKVAHGSMKEKDERLLRIQLNLDDVVIGATSIGIPTFKALTAKSNP